MNLFKSFRKKIGLNIELPDHILLGAFILFEVLKWFQVSLCVPNYESARILIYIGAGAVALYYLSPKNDSVFLLFSFLVMLLHYIAIIRVYPIFLQIDWSGAVLLLTELLICITLLVYGTHKFKIINSLTVLIIVSGYLFFFFRRVTGLTVLFNISILLLFLFLETVLLLSRLYHENQLKIQAVLKSEADLQKKLNLADAKIIEQEKTAMLATMTAGLAHEIYNPINFLQGNLQFLENYLNQAVKYIPDEKERKSIEEDTTEILKSYRNGFARITNIIQGLQSIFSKKQTAKKVVRISKILDTLMSYLSRS